MSFRLRLVLLNSTDSSRISFHAPFYSIFVPCASLISYSADLFIKSWLLLIQQICNDGKAIIDSVAPSQQTTTDYQFDFRAGAKHILEIVQEVNFKWLFLTYESSVLVSIRFW